MPSRMPSQMLCTAATCFRSHANRCSPQGTGSNPPGVPRVAPADRAAARATTPRIAPCSSTASSVYWEQRRREPAARLASRTSRAGSPGSAPSRAGPRESGADGRRDLGGRSASAVIGGAPRRCAARCGATRAARPVRRSSRPVRRRRGTGRPGTSSASSSRDQGAEPAAEPVAVDGITDRSRHRVGHARWLLDVAA